MIQSKWWGWWVDVRCKVNDWEANCNDNRVKHNETNGWAIITEINKECLTNNNKNGTHSFWMMRRGETKTAKTVSTKMTWKKTRNDKIAKKSDRKISKQLATADHRATDSFWWVWPQENTYYYLLWLVQITKLYKSDVRPWRGYLLRVNVCIC